MAPYEISRDAVSVMNVGIYGGTFDPIHFGHLNLVIAIKEHYQLDEIWLCPTCCSPFKKQSFANANHRYHMALLAVEDIPGFKVIDEELLREGPSFTIDTLQSLMAKAENQDKKFFLILGNDSLSSLHLWKNIEKIVEMTPLLIGKRVAKTPEILGPPSLQEAVKKGLFSSPIIEMNATDIRKRLKEGNYCGHLVPAKVLDYIYKNQLYLS